MNCDTEAAGCDVPRCRLFFCYGMGANVVRPYKGSGINREPASDAKLACESHGAKGILCLREQAAAGDYKRLMIAFAYCIPTG